MTLVQKIKNLADEKNTTFAEIERKTGISNGQIRRWDKSSPKAENLQKVATYLNVSTDYLLGLTDNPNMGMTAKQKELTIEEALASVMSSDGKPLTDNDRAILTGIIEAYIENSKSDR